MYHISLALILLVLIFLGEDKLKKRKLYQILLSISKEERSKQSTKALPFGIRSNIVLSYKFHINF